MNTTDHKVFTRQATRFDELAELIDEAGTIAICAHTNPDGDALGSELALVLLIREKWPDKLVVGLLGDDADVPRTYQFLAGTDQLVRASTYTAVPDLFICVDLPIPSRMNNGAAVCERSRRKALIDHHPCDEDFGDVAIRRPDAAATGIVITELALHLGIALTSDIADCLLTAIITDTGRFQYQNSDAEAFEVASMLVDAGASPSNISLNVYQSFRLAYLHLEAVVMGRIITFDNGRIAYSYATQADLERTGAQPDECDGLIDIVRSVEGSKIALFLKETGDGHVRGNLRSKGSYDVSAVANAMGGGGHVAAAGFTAEGGIDDVLTHVLPRLQELVDVDDKPEVSE